MDRALSTRQYGVSAVIGIALLVAVTVALVSIATFTVFNLGKSGSNAPNAEAEVEQKNGKVVATITRNENVEEFRLEGSSGEKTVSSVGESISLPAESGEYRLIAVSQSGTERVILTTSTVEDTGGSSDGQIVNGTVTGSIVSNANVWEIRPDGTIGSRTTTDDKGNYRMRVSDINDSQIYAFFAEKPKNSVNVTGPDNVASAYIKTLNGSETLDFNFSEESSDVITEPANIDGVSEVRYKINDDGERVITNVYQLQAINNGLNYDYEIITDIDATETENWNGEAGFNPIGNVGSPFTGSIDGAGYNISGITINRPAADNIGLFGVTSSTSEIRNLSVVETEITGGNSSIGSVIGRNSGNISDVYSEANITVDSNYTDIGGVVGYNTADGSVMDSEADGKIVHSRNYSDIGGLVGENSGGSVSNSYTTGSVFGAGNVSGLVGLNGDGGSVISSYSTGTVTGDGANITDSFDAGAISDNFEIVGDAGGLVGLNEGIVLDSNASASVSAYTQAGGLVGRNNGEVSGSYATGSVDGRGEGLGNVGGLAGFNQLNGTISDSYAIGDVGESGLFESSNDVGGLVGVNRGELSSVNASGNVLAEGPTTDSGGLAGDNLGGNISDSYATGDVDGTGYDGGLVGENENYEGYRAIIVNSYATGTIQGVGDSIGGLAGGSGGTIEDSFANGTVVSTENADLVGGLVGSAGGSSTIINSSSSANVIGTSDAVGGLVGINGGSISDSHASGKVEAGQKNAGGLVGNNLRGEISDSYATGNVTAEGINAGGLAGRNDLGTISGSYATGYVNGEDINAGGLVGVNDGGEVLDSYATGNVTVQSNFGGGLVGSNVESDVVRSYATGNVEGTRYIGGLVGENPGSNIFNSYATGNANGDSYVGGLAGRSTPVYRFLRSDIPSNVSNAYSTGSAVGNSETNGFIGFNNGEVSDVYWDIESSGLSTDSSATGLTTSQMQGSNSVGNMNLDFTNIWDAPTGEYPVLQPLDTQTQIDNR